MSLLAFSMFALMCGITVTSGEEDWGVSGEPEISANTSANTDNEYAMNSQSTIAKIMYCILGLMGFAPFVACCCPCCPCYNWVHANTSNIIIERPSVYPQSTNYSRYYSEHGEGLPGTAAPLSQVPPPYYKNDVTNIV